MNRFIVFGALATLLIGAPPARAQVASLGKGWLLGTTGSVTTAPGEVISGNASIKGDQSGTGVEFFLHTDPGYVHLGPNQTCTVTLKYRIITAAAGGFNFGFHSSTSEGAGIFPPSAVINGASGASGTASLTAALQNYADYTLSFNIGGPGAIVIDEISITNGAGLVVASEKAEGPSIVPGLLNFQLTDAMTVVPEGEGFVRSLTPADLDGDGYPELILTLTDNRTFATTSLHPVVVAAKNGMKVTTDAVFPSGAPTTKHSSQTLFTDISADGLPDLVFAEAQFDGPYTGPLTGPGIGVALNLGNGQFRNVQPLIPTDQQTNRSYSITAGDILGDGRVAILLSDELDGSNTALLRWNGTGFEQQKNWIAPSLWKTPSNLLRHDSLALADFDGDGRQDLLVGGSPAPCTPNLQLLFGASGGFATAGLVQLPSGPFGQGPCATTAPIAHNASVGPIVVGDFDNDGRPDIFTAADEVLTYQPGVITDTNEPDYVQILANGGSVGANAGIQVLLNQGGRQFLDVTSSSSQQILGHRHYYFLIAVDVNNDGFSDVVGAYLTGNYAGGHPGSGTTLFLNDGTGAFQVVDGMQVLAAATTTPSSGQQLSLGGFVPTIVTPGRTEGIFVDPVGGCGVGFCAGIRFNLYKVVANKSIGTGPSFSDPAALGVPGFNEFYYLRQHPDVAAAVQHGLYASGLAHYLAVGAGLGYRSHAPRSASDPAVSVTPMALRFGATNNGASLVARTSNQTVRILQSDAGTVTWTATSDQPWLTVSPAFGTGGGELSVGVIFHGALPPAGESAGTVTVTFTGARIGTATVPVTVKTMPQGSSTAPTGQFDTPSDGATGIAGSIAVTGWAVDDVEVTRVTICRDAVIRETAPIDPKCAGTAQIYIGDAVFVDGARPDVQTAYTTWPLNSRAGWGYLMLTNFLPALGNGTFTIRAYAFDAEGHTFAIGSKTISCSNATSPAPFGAIDLPAQGGVVSGVAYNVFGWVLAPAPARADPPGGGTVHMFIDGTDLGPINPGLWTTRADLQKLFDASPFPGINNALGVHTLDTTTLTNGVHSLFWIVTGTGTSGASGIGSRFVTVANSVSSVITAGARATSRLAVVIPAAVRIDVPEDTVVTNAPLDLSPIRGRRGFDLDRPLQDYTPSGGRIDVQAEELDRIELHLGAGRHTGYLRTASGLQALPIGSTLDESTGVFTWTPGVGFYGKYDLTIVRWNNGQAISRQDVRITLNAKGSNRVGPQTIIDTPTPGNRTGQPFVVAGWAADLDSVVDNGVTAVHVWAYALDASGNRLDPVFIGPATCGLARPDVAEVYGGRFKNSGYGVVVDTLPPGTYDIAVFAYSSVLNNFTNARVVRVTLR